MNTNKLICCISIVVMFFMISCKPVRIVSAKYNGSDIIRFPYGNMKIIAYTRTNTNYSFWFNYFFTDTLIFRPDIQTIHKGKIISHYPYEPNSKNPEYGEHILYGDSVLQITNVFNNSLYEMTEPDTFFVHISGFFDKRNNPIFINPIEYYIESMVNYNAFRDGYRDHVSSSKKIDYKKGYLIISDNGVCRRYAYGKPKKK